MNKLLIFDIDDTLVDAWTTDLRPGVAAWFAAWRERRTCDVAFATNQGGPALKEWRKEEEWTSSLPTIKEMIDQVLAIRAMLDFPEPQILALISTAYRSKEGDWSPIQFNRGDGRGCWRAASYYDWRKPEAGMLHHAMGYYSVIAPNTTMVGDSTNDKGAAEAAGVTFAWAEGFFDG